MPNQIPPSLFSKLLPGLLESAVLPNLVSSLAGILQAEQMLRRLWERHRYHGMYEIEEYDSTLEILDSRGDSAVLRRRQMIRFLQNNVVAIHDHAWGDGEIFGNYRCQPGIPVDFYKDGSRYNVLISLRETKNRGDMIEFWVEREIKKGLIQEVEWLETEIDHWTNDLKLSVIFPKERSCRRATLSSRNAGKTILLPEKHFALLPDGRQKLTWEAHRPRPYELYTITWTW